MSTFTINVYHSAGQKPTRSMVDVVYSFSVTPKEFIGSSEEKSKTTYHRIKVGISITQFKVWNKIHYNTSNEYWLKILYEFAKKHINKKLFEGDLSEYEELDLLSYNTPETCPFDPEITPPEGQWQFEVELPDLKNFLSGEEEITMNGIVRSFIARSGQTLIIHDNWGMSDASSKEVRGLKNSRRGKIIFQFNERDVKRGSVIQSKGTQDFWLVKDTEDGIINDTFDYLNAFVTKITEEGTPIDTPKNNVRPVTVINHGTVYGQQIGNNNTQTLTTGQDINEIVKNLKELLQASTIPELEKEDITEDLDRISVLSTKEKTEAVLERVNTRVGAIVNIVSKSQSLYENTKPWIIALKQYFVPSPASEIDDI